MWLLLGIVFAGVLIGSLIIFDIKNSWLIWISAILSAAFLFFYVGTMCGYFKI